MLANQIQQYIKRIVYHDQAGFTSGMQGWFNTYKSINMFTTLAAWSVKIIWLSQQMKKKALEKIQENSSLAYHAYFPLFFLQTISQSLA